MQAAWLLITAAIFGLGFLLGYFARARISWRRRRRSRYAAWPRPGDAEQIPLRLEQPQRHDGPGSGDDAGRADLRNTNAPPLAGVDLGRSPAARK
jgi:hypothetical protein